MFQFFCLFIYLSSSYCNIANILVENVTLNEVSEVYVSFAIDAAEIIGANFWDTSNIFNFSRPQLISLSKYLAPAILRVGGTTAVESYSQFIIIG